MQHKSSKERAQRTATVIESLDIKNDQLWTEDVFNGLMWEFILLTKKRRKRFIKYLRDTQREEQETGTTGQHRWFTPHS